MTTVDRADDPGALAERVGEAVRAVPGVVRLDGGAFGAVATHLPGGPVVGVHLATGADSTAVTSVEVSVVLALGVPIPEAVGRVRDRVRAVAGPVPVDVQVTDIADPDTPG